MSVYELILRRRTIRRFKQQPVAWPVLEKLVNAARLAPSGGNLQPCEFIVVDEPELVVSVFTTLKWAAYIAPRGTPPEGERPTAYIVVLINTEKRKSGGETDAAAAIMNIILMAQEEGLGTCWIGSVERERLQKLLAVPEYCIINAVVALGYPNESPVVEDLTGSVKYWKDEQGTLHVPKRRLRDVLHRNGYEKKNTS